MITIHIITESTGLNIKRDNLLCVISVRRANGMSDTFTALGRLEAVVHHRHETSYQA